jgi:hypothetical protein
MSATPKAAERNPGYQAHKLRGLAGLIRAADEQLHEPTSAPIAFFIASSLDEIADVLDGGE